MSQKGQNFLHPPPLPHYILDFFENGKNWKFDYPPPPRTYFRKNLNWENFEFWETPSEKKHKLKKWPKNHFKTNLFFVQLKHLKSTFTFGKKVKI